MPASGSFLRSLLIHRFAEAARNDESQGDHLSHRVRKHIDLRSRAERTGTDAHRPFREGAKRAMNVWGAVQARTDRDIERLIENAANLGRGQRVAAETQCADVPAVI